MLIFGWGPRPRVPPGARDRLRQRGRHALSKESPLASLVFPEVLATSDLASGVANLISGRRHEFVAHLARHMDVLAIADAGGDAALSKQVGEDAVVNVRRVKRYAIADYFSERAQGLDFIEAFTEIKPT